jgi:hypothetical protein
MIRSLTPAASGGNALAFAVQSSGQWQFLRFHIDSPLFLQCSANPAAFMATTEASMQSYYAARVPEYDSVYRKQERQPDLRSIEGWLPPRFTGETVLEIACGTGY